MGTVMMTVLATAFEAASEVTKQGAGAAGGGALAVLLALIVALLSSTVVANIVTAAMTRLRASAEVRRQRYAAAVKLLAERIEYPYRVRRRTDNEPATLAKLADLGHDLQQRLAETRAWVAAENAIMGDVFEACVATLDEPFKEAAHEAWEADPVTEPAQMNLNGFGLGDQQRVIASMQCALVYRFGWRRLTPNRKLKALLTENGCLGKTAKQGNGAAGNAETREAAQQAEGRRTARRRR